MSKNETKIQVRCTRKEHAAFIFDMSLFNVNRDKVMTQTQIFDVFLKAFNRNAEGTMKALAKVKPVEKKLNPKR